tara:strand:- start:490 stop:963 length:474 start_codon:yes stop_codon:yes gene_type:complete
MPRVTQESLSKLTVFLDTLPKEARNKCALCNETLTHIVKTAEAETGAPQSTVANEMANRLNDEAAPADQVTGNALNQRVRQKAGEKKRNLSNGQNKARPKKKKRSKSKGRCKPAEAMQLAVKAISQLKRISCVDPKRDAALNKVANWVNANRGDCND